MSELDNVFDSLGDEGVSAYTADPSTEEHIVIGPDRRITVPDSLKRLAVQYDHNAETVTFDCPRYWDGTDMFGMQIYINYLLPGGNIGSYIATNKVEGTDDPTIMHFDWTIRREVTQEKGNIIFLICVKDVADEGEPVESFHWNTELCKDCYISEGFEATDVITDENYDIITDLLTRVEVAEDQAEIATAKAEEAAVSAEAATEAAARSEEIADSLEWFENPNMINGEGEGSVKQKSASVAVSEDSVAMGTDTQAGQWGYKVNSVSSTAVTLASVEGLEAGMGIALLKNGATLSTEAVISSVDNDTNTVTLTAALTVDRIMMYKDGSNSVVSEVLVEGTALESFDSASSSDFYYLLVSGHPELGDTDIGKNARAFGTGSIARGEDSEANGTDVVANGDRARATGKLTQALSYGADASGRYTIAAANYTSVRNEANVSFAQFADVSGAHNTANSTATNSSTAGYYNENNGPHSHLSGWKNVVKKNARASDVGGRENTVDGDGNHIGGYRNNINGAYNTVGGQDNTVANKRCLVGGTGLKSAVDSQALVGQYNTPDANAMFIVGSGDSDTSRKNAFVVRKDGTILINNVLFADAVQTEVENVLSRFDIGGSF